MIAAAFLYSSERADQHRQAKHAADRHVAEKISVIAHLHDIVADSLGDGGGVDRQRSPEMQTDGQFATGFLLDLLDRRCPCP